MRESVGAVGLSGEIKKEMSLRKSDIFRPTEYVAGTGFGKLSFLVRKSDLWETSLPCIWSIENHVLIVKWSPTDVSGQFQITDRYNLWNAFEKHRYVLLSVRESEIETARESGFVTLDPEIMNEIQEHFE